ncbi:hypothetical protein [Bradyrhizobium sp. dw_411]|uniref:hypothetical protein n=1 Tax=Bradyrhizobium sp. dw_411 TaxID=2720082 RepID=UPI001BCF3657|nr:hypothetical protein [Bradyrhizobium sp. dw_411]
MQAYLREYAVSLKSAAEEQPQQNDHRYRHAQKPEQNSSSHHSLLEISMIQERAGRCEVPVRAT